MNESEQFEFTQLFEKLINETASEQEISTIEHKIISDSVALKLYQDLSIQHSYLHFTQGRDAQETPLSRKTQKRRSLTTAITAWTAVAAALILGATLLFQTASPPPQTLTSQATYATISDTSMAQWGRCSLPTQLQKQLTSGSLELLHGTATLTFKSGAIVTLEAPAEIEIISSMKAKVRHGRVVAEIPESAIGFRLDAPDMEIKDLGTVFAVSVDKQEGVSQVDVIDGEVEIFHHSSKDRKLLTTKQRATTNQEANSIGYSASTESIRPEEITAAVERNFFELTTVEGKGDNATIISSHANTHLHPHLLQAKHSIDDRYSRKFYLKFDLHKIRDKDIDQVILQLTQVRSPYGFTSFVRDCEFRVYALNTHSDEWNQEQINWQNAPANKINSGSLLDEELASVVGFFNIPRGKQEGMIKIECDKLADLIKNTNEQTITLVIARITREIKIGGLVHTFAGNKTPNENPPTLIFTKKR